MKNNFLLKRCLKYLSCTLLLLALGQPGRVLGFTTAPAAKRTTTIRRNLAVIEGMSAMLPTQLVSSADAATAMVNYQIYKNLADEFHMSLPPGNLSPEQVRTIFQAQQQAIDGRWSVSTAPPLSAPSLLPTVPGTAGGGFHLLGSHATNNAASQISPDQLASSAAWWSADMIRVVDTLPLIVLAYCLVEFLLLRPGIDRTNAADPVRAATDTAAVMIVRLGWMGILTALLLFFLYGAE